MYNIRDEPNLFLRMSRFNDILISAANNSCPENKTYQEIQTLDDSKPASKNPFKKSPPLDNTSKPTGMDWCLLWTHEAINEAETESWEDLSEDVMSNSDYLNIWKVFQGTPDARCPYEVMFHEIRTIADIRSKANVFINHYVMVRKVKSYEPIKTSTGNSRNVLKDHLMTMKALSHFKWVNYYLP